MAAHTLACTLNFTERGLDLQGIIQAVTSDQKVPSALLGMYLIAGHPQ